MNGSSHDFVTVDMRGLKAALVGRAQSERVSVSLLVRRAVGRELGGVGQPAATVVGLPTATASTVKLSVRVTGAEAERLAKAARLAGLSRGAFFIGLLDGIPSLSEGPEGRIGCLGALIASNAELASLRRNVHRLTDLLREGDVRAAREYRRALETLDRDVRAHLNLVAATLAQLRPARRPRGQQP